MTNKKYKHKRRHNATTRNTNGVFRSLKTLMMRELLKTLMMRELPLFLFQTIRRVTKNPQTLLLIYFHFLKSKIKTEKSQQL